MAILKELAKCPNLWYDDEYPETMKQVSGKHVTTPVILCKEDKQFAPSRKWYEYATNSWFLFVCFFKHGHKKKKLQT